MSRLASHSIPIVLIPLYGTEELAETLFLMAHKLRMRPDNDMIAISLQAV